MASCAGVVWPLWNCSASDRRRSWPGNSAHGSRLGLISFYRVQKQRIVQVWHYIACDCGFWLSKFGCFVQVCTFSASWGPRYDHDHYVSADTFYPYNCDESTSTFPWIIVSLSSKPLWYGAWHCYNRKPVGHQCIIAQSSAPTSDDSIPVACQMSRYLVCS